MGWADVRRHGDRMAAVSDLFEAHHRRLVGLARLLVDDQEPAEEVVREAFLALYRQWRVLRDTSAALAYLNRCVVNGGRKRLRRRILLASATSRVAPAATVIDSAEQDAVVHDEVDRVRRQIRALAGRQREVLVLRLDMES